MSSPAADQERLSPSPEQVKKRSQRTSRSSTKDVEVDAAVSDTAAVRKSKKATQPVAVKAIPTKADSGKHEPVIASAVVTSNDNDSEVSSPDAVLRVALASSASSSASAARQEDAEEHAKQPDSERVDATMAGLNGGEGVSSDLDVLEGRAVKSAEVDRGDTQADLSQNRGARQPSRIVDLERLSRQSDDNRVNGEKDQGAQASHHDGPERDQPRDRDAHHSRSSHNHHRLDNKRGAHLKSGPSKRLVSGGAECSAKQRRTRQRTQSYHSSYGSDSASNSGRTSDSQSHYSSDRRSRSRQRHNGSRKRARPGSFIPGSRRLASPRKEGLHRGGKRASKRVKRERSPVSRRRNERYRDSAHQFSDADSDSMSGKSDEQGVAERRRLDEACRSEQKFLATDTADNSVEPERGSRTANEASVDRRLALGAHNDAQLIALRSSFTSRRIAALPHRAQVVTDIAINPDWIEQKDPPLLLRPDVRASLVWNDWLHTLPLDMQPIVRWEWVGETEDDGGWRMPRELQGEASDLGGVEYWERTPAGALIWRDDKAATDPASPDNPQVTYRARLIVALPPLHPSIISRRDFSSETFPASRDYEAKVAQIDGLRTYEPSSASSSPVSTATSVIYRITTTLATGRGNERSGRGGLAA